MFAWLLIYRDKHDDHHALFNSYEAACEQIKEIVMSRLTIELHKDEQKRVEEHLEAKEYQEVIDIWNEHTAETIDLEEYEVQGSPAEAERRNVYAVLVSMAHQVLVEEVVGIRIEWEVGSPIKSNTVLQARYPVTYVNLQLPLPVVGNDGYKNPDES